jgi:hypothetical protein
MREKMLKIADKLEKKAEQYRPPDGFEVVPLNHRTYSIWLVLTEVADTIKKELEG